MSLLNNLATALGADRYFRLDLQHKELELTEHLLHRAASSAPWGDDLAHFELTIGDTLQARARMVDGHSVAADLVPYVLEVAGDVARVRARTPGGIRVRHERAWRDVLTRAFVGMTGATARRLNEVDGVSFDGDEISYERPVSALRFVSALGLGGRETWLPLSLRPGALVVDVSSISLPSAPALAAALMKALATGR